MYEGKEAQRGGYDDVHSTQRVLEGKRQEEGGIREEDGGREVDGTRKELKETLGEKKNRRVKID